MDRLSGKKILLVITKSNWGGAQSYVYTLAKEYVQHGAVVLVALGGTGEIGAETGLLAARLHEAEIPVRFLSSLARDVSVQHELRALSELTNLIREIRPDVLHLNSSKAGGLGALAGRLSGAPRPRIIFTAHGWAQRESRHILTKFSIMLTSWVTILLCDAVIVVSKRDYLDAPVLFSRRKIVLIRNGISSFFFFDAKDARVTLSAQQHIPIDGTWILGLGELHRNKGFDLAIRAFPEVLTEYPDVVLVIIGEGEERENLEKLLTKLELSNHVFLAGFISEPRRYLKAADVFIMPSRKEGLPYALLEAGLAGLPVIATDVGGIPEVIESKVTGLLTAPDSVADLTNALKQVLGDKTSAQKMGVNLEEKIRKDFSEEEVVIKTVATYFP